MLKKLKNVTINMLVNILIAISLILLNNLSFLLPVKYMEPCNLLFAQLNHILIVSTMFLQPKIILLITIIQESIDILGIRNFKP